MAPSLIVVQTSNCSLLLIYRPRNEERLSWPGVYTADLAPRPTVKHSKPRHVPKCQAQQTLHHAPQSRTANLAPCLTVRYSKPRPTPHCQAQQTSPHTPLSGTANLALCPIAKHRKLRLVPHCQAQQTAPCATLLVMMPEYICRMRHSGMAWQVCHVSHYLVKYINLVLTGMSCFALPR